MKLYELTSDYLAFMHALENGEIPEEAIADTLESITAGIEDKADSIACMLKSLAAEIAAFKEEEAKLAERRKVKERLHERIKQYLSDSLQIAGLAELETARNKITFRKSEAVELFNEDAFIAWAQSHRDDLLSYSAPTANKTAIKKALKDGAEIFGAKLRIKNNIQIK